MFGFKSRKKFFKSLNPGQIVKYRGYLSDQTILFEFGHYDEDEDIVYWQYARVVLGKPHLGDYVAMTAKVSDNGKLFEQQFSTNQKGWYSLADTKEIIRFEECTDKYMTALWFDGKLERNEVYLTERMDGRLSRLQLAIDPPEYVYVECDEDSGEFIFKCAGLSYSNSGNFKIQCKEMFMADDRPNLVSGDRELTICDYHHALIVREATDSERKLLILKCEEKKKEQMLKNKLPLFDSSFKTGDIMYADREHDSILFQYDHHQRIEGIEQIRCKEGVLKFSKDKETKTFDYYGRIGSYDSLLTFRLADESEKTLFLKEREYELKTERGKLALIKEQQKSDALSVKDLKRDDLVVLQDDDYKQIIEFKCVSDGAIGFQRKILEILDEHDYNIEHNDGFATIYPQHYKIFRRATDDEKKMFDDFMTRYSNIGTCIRKSYADELIEKRQKESDALRDKVRSFKPFSSKVLVSNGDGDVWRPAVFGCVAEGSNRFMIVGGQEYKYCVLYQKHRDLLGRKFKTGDERF